MHKDTIKGAMKDAEGSVKKNVGRATGNESMEAEGIAEQGEGKLQKGVGKLKDGVRLLFKQGGKKGLWRHPDGMSAEEEAHYQPREPASA